MPEDQTPIENAESLAQPVIATPITAMAVQMLSYATANAEWVKVKQVASRQRLVIWCILIQIVIVGVEFSPFRFMSRFLMIGLGFAMLAVLITGAVALLMLALS